MTIDTSPEIRLDPAKAGQSYTDGDWVLLETDKFRPRIGHTPTGTLFAILFDIQNRKIDDMLNVFRDYSARLIHVVPGFPVPQGEQLIDLGRAAIVVYLLRLRLWPKEFVFKIPNCKTCGQPMEPETVQLEGRDHTTFTRSYLCRACNERAGAQKFGHA